MLHNSGPFGPNETPINMGAPVNMPQITPMNIGQSNELNKLGQNPQESRSSHYNLSHYNPFGLPHLGMNPQVTQFPIYPGFQTDFPPLTDQQNSWQNTFFPTNSNAQLNHSLNTTSFPPQFNQTPSLQGVEMNRTIKKPTPLNIPEVHTKSFHTPQNTYYNDQNDQFYNSEENYNVSTPKPSEKYILDNTKRKSLENTVRLIEDLLNNTTKNKVAEKLAEQETQHIDVPKNVTNATTISTIEPKNYDSDVSDENMSQLNDEHTKSDTNPKPDIKDTNKPESVQVHHVEIKIELPDPDEEKEYDDPGVSIKIEPLNWIDPESDSPFQRDFNGVMKEDLPDYNQIVDGENSIAEATGAAKLDPNPAIYYECPHCYILVNHPKRFLIHTKWHMFGLTNERRMELAKERELKRRKKHQDRLSTGISPKDAELIENHVGPVFRCKDCDKVFLTKSSMKNHRYRVHPLQLRECKICHITLNNWQEHRAHLATHNNESGYYCADCPKKFKFAHSLAKHRDTHLEKTLTCDQCPKKFGSVNQLKSHSKVHERAERGLTFHCSYCGKGFYEAYNLGVHERTHRNERPFLCAICNTSFGTNSSLKRHLKVSHNSAKPYACTVCHRSFISQSIRDRHEMRQHGDPKQFTFECDQCELRYLTNKDLQKHVYKVHPKSKRKKNNTDSE